MNGALRSHVLRPTPPRALWMLLALGLLIAPSLASAQNARVGVTVALASTNGTDVDPRLQRFAAGMKKRLVHTSFKVVEARTLDLAPGGTGSVSLPNGKSLAVTLEKRNADGSIVVRTQGGVSTQVELKPGAELSLDAGQQGDGQLWVLLRNG